MTVLFTVFGTIVFIISFATVGFKKAFRRLMLFALTGFMIDAFIVLIAVGVMHMSV